MHAQERPGAGGARARAGLPGGGRDDAMRAVVAGRPLSPRAAEALQRRAGNAALQRVLTDDEGDPMQLDEPPGAGEPVESVAELRERIIRAVNDTGAKFYGGGLHGRVTDELLLRFQRDKSGERTTQILSQLSMLLYDTVRGVQDRLNAQEPGSAPENDREVQGMLVNDRLLFASNYNVSFSRMFQGEIGEAAASLEELLAVEQSEQGRTGGLTRVDANEYVQRLSRAAAKVGAAMKGLRPAGDATKAVREQTGKPVVRVDVDDPRLHDLLAGNDHRGKVFLVVFDELGTKRMHAEQKLLLALSRAGLEPEAVAATPLAISGKYRPCVGCAAALRYYKEVLGYEGLQYNTRHGHYYQASVDTAVKHLVHVSDGDTYLGYVKEMLDSQENPMSTAALSGHGAPEGASDEEELRIRAEDAYNRGYVTNSDSEWDEATATSVERPSQPYEAGSGGRTLGPGSAQSSGGRARTQTATVAEQEEIRRLWGKRERNEPGADEEVKRYFKQLTGRSGPGVIPVTLAEIARAIAALTGGSEASIANTVGYIVNGGTGHKRRREEGSPERNVRKGNKTREWTRTQDDLLEQTIAPDAAFLAKWRQRRDAGGTAKLRPSDMAAPTFALVFAQFKRFTQRQIADGLFMSMDSLRKNQNWKNAVQAAAQAPEDADTED